MTCFNILRTVIPRHPGQTFFLLFFFFFFAFGIYIIYILQSKVNCLIIQKRLNTLQSYTLCNFYNKQPEFKLNSSLHHYIRYSTQAHKLSHKHNYHNKTQCSSIRAEISLPRKERIKLTT